MPSLAALALLVATTPVLQATADPGEDFCIECCSLYCAVAPTLSVSRHLAPERSATYDHTRLEDGKTSTAWVVEGGPGESLAFTFPESDPAASHRGLDALYLSNGYGRTPQHWKDHARVRELDLLVNDETLARIQLLDEPGPQRADLPRIPLTSGMRLVLLIRSVYPGARFGQTAISEVRLDGYGHH